MFDIVLDGSLWLALPLALLAGLVSFLSPCVLPLVPGYLGYVSSSATERSRIVLGSVLFVSGFTAVFVALGSTFGSLGVLIHSDFASTLQRVLGAVIIVFGFILMGGFGQRQFKMNLTPKAGLFGAPLLGAAFGLGWTPCIGPTLSAVLTLSLDEATTGRGALLSLAYSIGIGLPFILLAFGFSWATGSVKWVKSHIRAINIAGGVLLIALGALMLTGVWAQIVSYLQVVFGDFTPAI
ncbi:MAG: cytochrome c biogenesis CcdA family protein [Microbacteriaceae bacterium]